MSDWTLGSDTEEELWRQRLEAETEELAWLHEQSEYEYWLQNLRKGELKMPSINDVYGGGKGLRAADLRGHTVPVTIADVRVMEFDSGKKIIVRFEGKDKDLVLNVTNARTIASKYGDDWNKWAGAEIEIYPDKTNFQGQLVDCIRVRIPLPVADKSEEIPF